MKKMWQNIRMYLWMTALTGLIYPLFITGIAQLTMKKKAGGNFIVSNDKIIGAALIGQKFESDKYFWPRPSAIDYNPLPSGGSNLGPTSAALKKAVDERKQKIEKSSNFHNENIPTELLFASGSGLDPHISVDTAYFQIGRIAKARNMDNKDITHLIDHMTIKRTFGFLGDPHVNVLMLNIALDDLKNKQQNK